MLGVTVQGGTGAGRRRVKQLVAWICRCGEWRSSYSCGICGARRGVVSRKERR